MGLGEQYNRWVYKSRVATVNKVIKNLGIDFRGKKVLDVGCGTGFGVVAGVDISETSIHSLRQCHPLGQSGQ
jgi:ubiquinone/menaquinone biosynthesis C-methylase UbiE